MAHLQSGLRLLSSSNHAQEEEKTKGLRMLAQIFQQLDLQATLFDDERMPSLGLAYGQSLHGMLRTEKFIGVGDAHRSLIRLQHELSRFLVANAQYKLPIREQIPMHILEEKAQLLHSSKLWKVKCDNLMNRQQPGDQTMRGVRALLIQWHVSGMLLEADYPTNAAVFGTSPNPRAQEIIALARCVLMPSEIKNVSAETSRPSSRKFSSDTGVVAPLFILAMKCSEESIRAEAAALLSASHRREGLYDSESMAAIINQLERTKQEREERSQDSMLQDMQNLSLEKSFAHDLDKRTGGMDKLADFIEPRTDSTYDSSTISTRPKQ